MANEIQWATILGTPALAIAGASVAPSLKNLANGTAKIGNEIAGNRHHWSAWELRVRFQAVPSVIGTIDLHFVKALDDTDFEDGSDSVLPDLTSLAVSFPVAPVTTQQRITIDRIPLPPLDFKPLIVNSSGAAMTDVDDENVLRFQPYNDEVE